MDGVQNPALDLIKVSSCAPASGNHKRADVDDAKVAFLRSIEMPSIYKKIGVKLSFTEPNASIAAVASEHSSLRRGSINADVHRDESHI